MIDNERVLKLEARNAQLEQQITFLRSEMRVAIKGFLHNNLNGHAWVCEQALKMVSNQLNEGELCEI